MGAPQEWARQWLEEKRKNGSKGLTLELRGDKHYVIWATTEWIKGEGKRKKISEYIGILEPPGNLVVSSDIDVEKMDKRAIDAAGIDIARYRKYPDQIIDYRIKGGMMVIRFFFMDDYMLLREFFPNTCDDLAMLAFARLARRGRLRQAPRWFITQDNLFGLNPHMDPALLSSSLTYTGAAIDAQDKFFEALATPGKKMAADMTFCFSKGHAFLTKKGYNRFKLSCGQFNLVVICGLDDRLPQMIKTVAGNVKEGCLKDILQES